MSIIFIIITIIIITIIIIIIIISSSSSSSSSIIELTPIKNKLENTVEIDSQPVAWDFKNLSQYSSCSM